MRINVHCFFYISAILFASIIFVCDTTKVNVMLSLTTVNKDCKLNQPEKLMAQLRQLKSGGVDGIMVDIWWGIVEQSPKKYNFDGYVELVKMASEIGLKVQFVASFHQCGGNVGDECSIDLPSWVLDVGQWNKSIFYTDQYGDADPEYISLGANNARIFNGRTPLDMYRDFFIAMTETFRPWMPHVIDEIQVGLGPTGELRYPGYQMRKNKWTYCGIGEFQCYDSFMLESLKKAALKVGHPEWSNRGPSNAGHYNSRPHDTDFFSGGFDNYNSPYGRFFLNWYFEHLKDHGRAVLKRAKDVFSPIGVSTAAKIAGIHWWYDHASHAAEVTTGYYNTGGRNAYYELAQVLAETNTAFCFTCLEMRNQDYCASRPETLIHQTMNAAFDNNISFSGENAIDVCEGSCRQHDFDQIVRQTRSMRRPMKHFTYLRLRDSLLAGNNWNMFVNFVNEMHRAN